jgi:type IV secretory pathway TrbL component
MGDWKVWVKGIAAAVIGGAASAFAAALGTPAVLSDTRSLLRTSVVGAALSAAAYLKKSPLPAAGTEEKE